MNDPRDHDLGHEHHLEHHLEHDPEHEPDGDRRLVEALYRRAERGTPRGADATWAAVSRESTAPRRRGRGTAAGWLPAAAVAAVAAVLVTVSLGTGLIGTGLVGTGLVGDGADDPVPAATPRDASTTAASPGPPSPSAAAPSPTTPAERSAAYLACARERGVVLDYAEVQRSRTPDWVKTLEEVPAEVHRPCLQAIGGRDPLASSGGVPTTLGACESVDRTPPIDWRPAPAQSFPGSVAGGRDLTVTRGSATVVLPLAQGVAEVPAGVVVECWNGQAWQPAYVATGLGGDDASTAELEEGVRPGGGRVPAPDGALDLPVPSVAPVTTYRVRGEATRCSSADECRRAPLEAAFSVTLP